MVSLADADTSDTDRPNPPQFELINDDTDKAINIRGWRISSSERPIASSIREEELRSQLNIKPPTMLFDESIVRIKRDSTRFELLFSAVDALRMVGEADPSIKVKAAERWTSKGSRNDVEITTIEHASDWTFTTEYTGSLTEVGDNVSCATDLSAADCNDHQLSTIDYSALRDTSLPILFSSEVVLFEDELDDNGIASFRVRLRVMPTFFFVLARFFLRVDGVLIRVYDTRYFHQFGSGIVVREINRRQCDLVSALKHVHPSILRDPDMAAPHIPSIYAKLDNIPT